MTIGDHWSCMIASKFGIIVMIFMIAIVVMIVMIVIIGINVRITL